MPTTTGRLTSLQAYHRGLCEAYSILPDLQLCFKVPEGMFSQCILPNCRIIEPLASRCAKFRFKPLNLETQLARVQLVREAENVSCPDSVLQRIVELSGGDLRQAITCLQSAHRYRDLERFGLVDPHPG